MKLWLQIAAVVLGVSITGCGGDSLTEREQRLIVDATSNAVAYQGTDAAVAACIDSNDPNCIERNGDYYGELLDQVPAIIDIYRESPDATLTDAAGKQLTVADALRDIASELESDDDPEHAGELVEQIDRELE